MIILSLWVIALQWYDYEPEWMQDAVTGVDRVYLDGEVFLGVIDSSSGTMYRLNLDNFQGTFSIAFGSWIHVQGIRYGKLIIPNELRPIERKYMPFTAITPLPPPPIRTTPNPNRIPFRPNESTVR